jgi:hypothetical protein
MFLYYFNALYTGTVHCLWIDDVSLDELSGKLIMVKVNEAHYNVAFNELTEIRFPKTRLNTKVP